jgi:hypothetical protein
MIHRKATAGSEGKQLGCQDVGLPEDVELNGERKGRKQTRQQVRANRPGAQANCTGVCCKRRSSAGWRRSRRELLKQLAAAAVTLPVILTVTAPRANATGSKVACSRRSVKGVPAAPYIRHDRHSLPDCYCRRWNDEIVHVQLAAWLGGRGIVG